jgi:hypothetical protein
MRTRVRVIFTLWVAIAATIIGMIAVEVLSPDAMFWLAFALLVVEVAALFAIWRTQPTFRKLVHWASGGLWPREGDAT